jgi:ribosomal protein L40E
MAACAKCGAENPQGSKFCANCGGPLSVQSPLLAIKCTKCGTENIPGSKFCVSCGSPMAQIPPPPQQIPVNRCIKCGVENPTGSRFCVNCGNTLEPTVQSPPTSFAAVQVQAVSKNIQQAKWVFIAGLCGSVLSVISIMSAMSTLERMYGPGAGNTFGVGLFLHLVAAGVALYAFLQLQKGKFSFAKKVTIPIAIWAGLFLLLALSRGQLLVTLFNAAIVAGMIWARSLFIKEERGQ